MPFRLSRLRVSRECQIRNARFPFVNKAKWPVQFAWWVPRRLTRRSSISRWRHRVTSSPRRVIAALENKLRAPVVFWWKTEHPAKFKQIAFRVNILGGSWVSGKKLKRQLTVKSLKGKIPSAFKNKSQQTHRWKSLFCRHL